jgi:serine/threonine-protein kinase
MKLLTKKPQALMLDEGAVLDGYVVEGIDDAHAGPELRYAVSGPGGVHATLLMSRRPFADRHERARFRRLAALRVRFSHPAAIEVRDFGEHANHPYIVAEPHDSERTFGDLLAEQAPLDPGRLIAMLAPIAAALDVAHGQGLVHQGLGSDSLLLGGHDSLLLDSFALFEVGGESAFTTAERADLRYRPPEQVRAAPMGPSGNVYALAALMVHALTGEPPYSGNRFALNYAHLVEPPPELSKRAPALDPAIDTVIARALAKEPARRPSSATALLAQVASALGTAAVPQTAGAATPTAPAPRRASAPRGRRISPRGAIAVGAAVAALCGGMLALAVDPFGDDAPSAPPRPAAADVWKRLDAERADLRARLATADAPQEQAELGRRLASAYDDAARAAGPGAQAREARAVRDAYAWLAASAEAGHEPGYVQASEAIAATEQRLQARR